MSFKVTYENSILKVKTKIYPENCCSCQKLYGIQQEMVKKTAPVRFKLLK